MNWLSEETNWFSVERDKRKWNDHNQTRAASDEMNWLLMNHTTISIHDIL